MRTLGAVGMKNKYNAKKTVVDGIKFDSVKESKRYLQLRLLEKEDKITDLRLQPSFVLQPSFMYCGKTVREIKYVADFMYHDLKVFSMVVEDVKGFKTDAYQLKKKMFLKKYGNGFIFREV